MLLETFLNETIYNAESSIFANNSAFSDAQMLTLRIIGRVLAGFSAFSLFIVFFLFWFYKSVRSFALELVVYLCFNNMMFNISYFLPTPQSGEDSSVSCKIQGFLSTWFDMSAMIWCTIVGYTAWVSVKKQEHLEHNKMKYRITYHVIALTGPLIFAIMYFL
jgi:hypothetical protein